MFDNVQDALEYVMGRRNDYYSFAGFKQVMHSLNDPQNGFLTIHVAGTNGKGSTISYLRDLLISQGYRVGTMQSPHYETHLDRIRVDGEVMEEDAFLNIVNSYYGFIEENHLSMFEIDYIVMCEYFKLKKIDVAIVEVGLGGRLDSTNVIDNTYLSIITTIGFDHMDRLGNTLREICLEKCGIIKDNSKTLIGHLDDDLKDLVKDICLSKKSAYYELGDYSDLGDRRFLYEGEEYELLSYASYQIHNAALALKALHIFMEDQGRAIDYEKAKQALKATLWKGRFEIISETPRIILDGGHNIHGIKALCQSYDKLAGTKAIIFSALRRKDYKQMAKELSEHCDRLVVTSFGYNGAIQDDLDNEYEKADNLLSALDRLKDYDNILICGSLYFISETWEMLKKKG